MSAPRMGIIAFGLLALIASARAECAQMTASSPMQGVQAAAPHRHLTLRDAEAQALGGHPRVQASEDAARAAGEGVREARSTYMPLATAAVTGAVAQDGTRLAAGGLNNPTVLDRAATGVLVSQMITDFGRTPDLVRSSSLHADARRRDAAATRAEVLLRVDRAYFAALGAQAVQRVAEQTVAARQLIVDQVSALAASGLKSSLDVSFAKVSLAEAQLLLVQARNDVAAASADLSVAIGAPPSALVVYDLEDEPLPAPPPADSATLVRQALAARPDLAAARLAQQAAAKLADAEGKLWRPTVSAIGAAGVTPYHEAGLTDRYAAAGVNVAVPLTNGHLFAARHAQASFEAAADAARVRDLELTVSRDVEVAWLAARTAFERLGLTKQLLAQATDARDLAQARYNLGLSSIVELTQAQLSETRAEIEQSTARYDYQARAAALRYELGTPPTP